MSIVVVGAREDDEVYELANKKVRKYNEQHEMNSRKGEQATVPLFLTFLRAAHRLAAIFDGLFYTFGHIPLRNMITGVMQTAPEGKTGRIPAKKRRKEVWVTRQKDMGA